MDLTSPHLFIGISGIIGVGKSWLTKALAEYLGFEAFFEPVTENPYLDDFYKDMKQFGFPMQVYLLNERFRQHQQAIWKNNGVVQDRTIYEDCIFAKMLSESGDISKLDYQTYKNLFINMTNFLHRPDVIIYLDVEPETALKRINHRNRDCESELPLQYLVNLKAGYDEWLDDIEPRIPVIRIDWNEFKSVEYVVEQINSILVQKNKIHIPL